MAEGQSRVAGRTGVCRHCGALVGAGEERCMMCGTAAAQPQSQAQRRRRHADPETVRFLRAVISRPATFTFVFIVANVFLYLLMSFTKGGASGETLLAYGAKRNDLIQAGQWWRFVTPVFLHVNLPGLGPMHLIANMYGLFMLGPFVEKLYGSARFVVFWILTGVAGVFASYLTVNKGLAQGALGQFLFKGVDAPSAGASGALFGLIGVLFVFGLKYRKELPEGLKRAFGTGMLPTILINLFIGYVARGAIDNAAHLGGLASGMLFALFVGYKRPGARGAVAVAWHAAQVACLALVAVSFVMVAQHFRDPVAPFSSLDQQFVSVTAFIEAVNAGQNALANYLAKDDGSSLQPAAEKLENTPGPGRGDALRDELRSLLVRARDDAGDRSLNPGQREQRKARIGEDFDEWWERFREWVKEEGEEIGVRLPKPAGTPEKAK
ncbi:MAG TPA: rhomboid family intramembrane serine protease [Pyrinomonadaceae bacterium]|nr:rhomboid family intramembrane serine protease [Pyrinomonadaceae bacterium]